MTRGGEIHDTPNQKLQKNVLRRLDDYVFSLSDKQLQQQIESMDVYFSALKSSYIVKRHIGEITSKMLSNIPFELHKGWSIFEIPSLLSILVFILMREFKNTPHSLSAGAILRSYNIVEYSFPNFPRMTLKREPWSFILELLILLNMESNGSVRIINGHPHNDLASSLQTVFDRYLCGLNFLLNQAILIEEYSTKTNDNHVSGPAALVQICGSVENNRTKMTVTNLSNDNTLTAKNMRDRTLTIPFSSISIPRSFIFHSSSFPSPFRPLPPINFISSLLGPSLKILKKTYCDECREVKCRRVANTLIEWVANGRTFLEHLSRLSSGGTDTYTSETRHQLFMNCIIPSSLCTLCTSVTLPDSRWHACENEGDMISTSIKKTFLIKMKLNFEIFLHRMCRMDLRDFLPSDVDAVKVVREALRNKQKPMLALIEFKLHDVRKIVRSIMRELLVLNVDNRSDSTCLLIGDLPNFDMFMRTVDKFIGLSAGESLTGDVVAKNLRAAPLMHAIDLPKFSITNESSSAVAKRRVSVQRMIEDWLRRISVFLLSHIICPVLQRCFYISTFEGRGFETCYWPKRPARIALCASERAFIIHSCMSFDQNVPSEEIKNSNKHKSIQNNIPDENIEIELIEKRKCPIIPAILTNRIFPCMRMKPKSSAGGFRPLINLSKKATGGHILQTLKFSSSDQICGIIKKNASTYSQQSQLDDSCVPRKAQHAEASSNQVLVRCGQMLNLVRTTGDACSTRDRCFTSPIGVSVLGMADVGRRLEQWQSSRLRKSSNNCLDNQQQSLFYVVADLKGCYESISIQKALKAVDEANLPAEFSVRRIFRSSAVRPLRTFHANKQLHGTQRPNCTSSLKQTSATPPSQSPYISIKDSLRMHWQITRPRMRTIVLPTSKVAPLSAYLRLNPLELGLHPISVLKIPLVADYGYSCISDTAQVKRVLAAHLHAHHARFATVSGVFKPAGLPQGSLVSPLLCAITLGATDRKVLPAIYYEAQKQDAASALNCMIEEDLCLRWVDDFLFVSPSRQRAEHFLKLCQANEWGELQDKKLRTNLADENLIQTTSSSQPAEQNASPIITWAGLKFILPTRIQDPLHVSCSCWRDATHVSARASLCLTRWHRRSNSNWLEQAVLSRVRGLLRVRLAGALLSSVHKGSEETTACNLLVVGRSCMTKVLGTIAAGRELGCHGGGLDSLLERVVKETTTLMVCLVSRTGDANWERFVHNAQFDAAEFGCSFEFAASRMIFLKRRLASLAGSFMAGLLDALVPSKTRFPCTFAKLKAQCNSLYRRMLATLKSANQSCSTGVVLVNERERKRTERFLRAGGGSQVSLQSQAAGVWLGMDETRMLTHHAAHLLAMACGRVKRRRGSYDWPTVKNRRPKEQKSCTK